MPPRFRNPCPRVSRNDQAVVRDRCSPFDYQLARGVIETQEIQLCSRSRMEDVRERHRRSSSKGGRTGRLDGDIKRVLHHARRQHIHHEFRRDSADADLWIYQWLPVGPHQAARLNLDRQLGLLLRREIRRGGGIDANGGRIRVADGMQNRLLQSREINAAHGGGRGLRGVQHHAGHDRIVLPRLDVECHDHFRVVNPVGRIGRGSSIDDEFDTAGRYGRQNEAAVSAAVDVLVLQSDDVNLCVRNRVQINIVCGH